MAGLSMALRAEDNRVVKGIRSAIGFLNNVMDNGVTPSVFMTNTAIPAGFHQCILTNTFRKRHSSFVSANLTLNLSADSSANQPQLRTGILRTWQFS